MFNRRSIIFASVAAAFLIGLIGFGFLKTDSVDTSTPEIAKISEPVSTPTDTKPPQEVAAETKPSTDITDAEKEQAYQDSLMAALPASLKGVPAPESLDADSAGNLVINDKIRKMFDHYLSTIGEEDVSMSRDRIELLLSRQLPEPALSQALEILGGYMDYKTAVDSIVQQSSLYQSEQFDGQTIAAVKEQIRRERSNYFANDVIETFFAREDQYDDYMIARSKISNNTELSETEKTEAMARLNQDSPAWLVEQNVKAHKIDNYQSKERALRSSGAESWEIQDLRRRELGDEAAANLELLDQRRADWSARLDAYRQEVDAAMAQYDDIRSPAAIARRDAIRAEHFKDNELRRVMSLDALGEKH